MFKNTAGQKLTVFAFADSGHATLDAGEPVTGDAANISCKVEQDDDGTQSATNDVAPTEVEDGQYRFDLTQAETNGDKLTFYPESSTAGVQVIAWPNSVIYTRPPNFGNLGIESDGDLTKVNTLDGHTAQTGDTFAQLPSNFSAMNISATGVVDADVTFWVGQVLTSFVVSGTYGNLPIIAVGNVGGAGDVTTDDLNADVRLWNGEAIPATTQTGVPLMDINAIDGNQDAATLLKNASLAMATVTVQTAEASANTDTAFDTDLPLENANYYGDDNGGLVIAWISSAANKTQTARVILSATGTANTRLTMEKAFDAIPADGDVAVILGRITELS